MSRRGCTWALRLASRNAPLPGSAPAAADADASPPWQSVHAIARALFWCIDGLSGLWHERHPALFFATSASLCCRGTCGADVRDCRGASACDAQSSTPLVVCPIRSGAAAPPAPARAVSDAAATGIHPIAARMHAIRTEAKRELMTQYRGSARRTARTADPA